MKYETFNEWNDYIFGGTGLQGYLTATRNELVSKLGEPTKPEGIIKERWLLKFEDGTVATIFSDAKTHDNEWCVSSLPTMDKKTKVNIGLTNVYHLFNA